MRKKLAFLAIIPVLLWIMVGCNNNLDPGKDEKAQPTNEFVLQTDPETEALADLSDNASSEAFETDLLHLDVNSVEKDGFVYYDPSKNYEFKITSMALPEGMSSVNHGDTFEVTITLEADNDYQHIPVSIFMINKTEWDASGETELQTATFLKDEAPHLLRSTVHFIPEVTAGVNEYQIPVTIPKALILMDENGTPMEEAHPDFPDMTRYVYENISYSGEFYIFPVLDPEQTIAKEPNQIAADTESLESIRARRDLITRPLNTDTALLKTIEIKDDLRNKQDLRFERLELNDTFAAILLPVQREYGVKPEIETNIISGTLAFTSINKAADNVTVKFSLVQGGQSWDLEVLNPDGSGKSSFITIPEVVADQESSVSFTLSISESLQRTLQAALQEGRGDFYVKAALDPDGAYSATEMNPADNYGLTDIIVVDDEYYRDLEASIEPYEGIDNSTYDNESTYEENNTPSQKITRADGRPSQTYWSVGEKKFGGNEHASGGYNFGGGLGIKKQGGDIYAIGGLYVKLFSWDLTIAEGLAYAGLYTDEVRKEQSFQNTGVDVHLTILNFTLYEFKQNGRKIVYEKTLSKEFEKGFEYRFYVVLKVEAGIKAEAGIRFTVTLEIPKLSVHGVEVSLGGEATPFFNVGVYVELAIDLFVCKAGVRGDFMIVEIGVPTGVKLIFDIDLDRGIIGMDMNIYNKIYLDFLWGRIYIFAQFLEWEVSFDFIKFGPVFHVEFDIFNITIPIFTIDFLDEDKLVVSPQEKAIIEQEENADIVRDEFRAKTGLRDMTVLFANRNNEDSIISVPYDKWPLTIYQTDDDGQPAGLLPAAQSVDSSVPYYLVPSNDPALTATWKVNFLKRGNYSLHYVDTSQGARSALAAETVKSGCLTAERLGEKYSEQSTVSLGACPAIFNADGAWKLEKANASSDRLSYRMRLAGTQLCLDRGLADDPFYRKATYEAAKNDANWTALLALTANEGKTGLRLSECSSNASQVWMANLTPGSDLTGSKQFIGTSDKGFLSYDSALPDWFGYLSYDQSPKNVVNLELIRFGTFYSIKVKKSSTQEDLGYLAMDAVKPFLQPMDLLTKANPSEIFWTLRQMGNSHFIVNKKYGMCLTIGEDSAGIGKTAIFAEACDYSDKQLWAIESAE